FILLTPHTLQHSTMGIPDYKWEENSSESDYAPLITPEYSSTFDEQNGLESYGTIVPIRIPDDSTADDKFPKERRKTFLSFVLLFIAVEANVIMLSMVHERV
ncbi:hypothetical protein PMAYCL1PPCAC_15599, partial [Pristionchus mayeri]